MNPFSVSAWYRSAAGWSISLFILIIYLAIAFDVLELNNHYLNYLILLWLGGGLILWTIGKLTRHNPKRVMAYMSIVGFFGYMPLFFTLSIAATGFSLVLTQHTRFIFLLSLLAVTIFWCAYQLRGYRRRIIEYHFIEKEFYVEDEQITMRIPSKISLDAPQITDKTLWGRAYNKFGPYLFLLIPFAYPLQKLIRDESGFLGGLFLIAIFAAPLMIYMLGRLTCGIYLYLYQVWQLERQYTKPVVFNPND